MGTNSVNTTALADGSPSARAIWPSRSSRYLALASMPDPTDLRARSIEQLDLGALVAPRRSLGVGQGGELLFAGQVAPFAGPAGKEAELLALSGDRDEAPLERGEDGRRAGGDEALHEQDEEPHGRSVLGLRPPVPVAHVVGDGLVQRTFDGPAAVRNGGENRRPGSEERPPVVVGGVTLLGAHHERPDAGSVDRAAMEESVVEQREQAREGVGLAGVRRRGQQEQPRRRLREQPTQLVPGDVLARSGDVMGLVDDDEVPARLDDGANTLIVVRGDALGAPASAAPHRLHGID